MGASTGVEVDIEVEVSDFCGVPDRFGVGVSLDSPESVTMGAATTSSVLDDRDLTVVVDVGGNNAGTEDIRTHADV